jgi:hypothetical protein
VRFSERSADAVAVGRPCDGGGIGLILDFINNYRLIDRNGMAVFRPEDAATKERHRGPKNCRGVRLGEGLLGMAQAFQVRPGGCPDRASASGRDAAPRRSSRRSEGSAGDSAREQKDALCDVPGGTCDPGRAALRRASGERTHNAPFCASRGCEAAQCEERACGGRTTRRAGYHGGWAERLVLRSSVRSVVGKQVVT